MIKIKLIIRDMCNNCGHLGRTHHICPVLTNTEGEDQICNCCDKCVRKCYVQYG